MRFRRLAATATLLSAFVAGACGAAPDGPGEVVSFNDALEAMLDQDTMGLRLRVVGDPDDVADFFADDSTTAEDNARDAGILLDSSLGAAFDRDGEFSFDATVGGIERAVEMRGSPTAVYARGDVNGIAGLFGVSPADVNARLTSLRSLGLDEPLDALLANHWISTELAPLESFMKGMTEGRTGEGLPSFDFSELEQRAYQLRTKLPAALKAAATSELVGTDATGHHYELSISTRKAAEAFLPLVLDLYQGMIPADAFPAIDDIPDRTVSADAWVSNGRLVRVELDLTQFDTASASPGPVSLRLDLTADPGEVVIPPEATNVDLVKLFTSFTTAYAQESSSSSSYATTPGFPSVGYENEAPGS